MHAGRVHGEPQKFIKEQFRAVTDGWLLFSAEKWRGGEWIVLKIVQTKSNQERLGNRCMALIPQTAFTAFLTLGCLLLTVEPAGASDIFGIAKNAMQTVYTDVAGIATVAAVVCASVCLFLMNFSKSGRTVDESRAWLKRIVICWAVLMTLGAIVTYFEKIIPKSMFGG